MHATQRAFVHAHQGREHDLARRHDREAMHRARRDKSDQVRDMRRKTIAGGKAPAVAQAEGAVAPAAARA